MVSLAKMIGKARRWINTCSFHGTYAVTGRMAALSTAYNA
jgi:hypothetical protein